MTKSYSFFNLIIIAGIIIISALNAQSSKNYDKELRRLNAKIDRVRVLVDSLEFNDRLLLPELMSAFRQAVSSKTQQDSITVVIMKRINTLNNKIAKLELFSERATDGSHPHKKHYEYFQGLYLKWKYNK